MEVTVRDASLSDAERLVQIYGYYVEHTAISFEYERPSPDEFRVRMERIGRKHPYLVIKCDGLVQGYAYAAPFKARPAYDWSCETTIYIDHSAKGGGLGRQLYEALEARLKAMGIVNLYACIVRPERDDEYVTRNSADFHAHLGYAVAGTFRKCGYKFGRWYDMVWMEKIIGEHRAGQPAPKSYGQISLLDDF